MSSNSVTEGEFCWNELMTNDVTKAKEFYSSLFGWEIQEHDMGGFTYTLFKNGNKDVGGMMQIPKEHASHLPPHWMSYIFVEDVDAATTKAKSLGAKVKQEPMSIPNVGRFAVFEDPTGAHIAIWESKRHA